MTGTEGAGRRSKGEEIQIEREESTYPHSQCYKNFPGVQPGEEL